VNAWFSFFGSRIGSGIGIKLRLGLGEIGRLNWIAKEQNGTFFFFLFFFFFLLSFILDNVSLLGDVDTIQEFTNILVLN